MNSYCSLYVMVVFGCKYRLALIDERWNQQLYKLFSSLTDDYGQGSKLIAAGGIADQVHLLLSLSQNVAPSNLIREIKSRSSHWVNNNKFCMGRFGWQNGCGYFSFSVSALNDVKQYVLNQKEHHRGRGFRDEMMALYKKHGFMFNEFYLPEELI